MEFTIRTKWVTCLIIIIQTTHSNCGLIGPIQSLINPSISCFDKDLLIDITACEDDDTADLPTK